MNVDLFERLDFYLRSTFSTSSSELLAIYLFKHPGKVVFRCDRKLTYYVYDPITDCIWYRIPENKTRNGWYLANGLTVHFCAWCKTMIRR